LLMNIQNDSLFVSLLWLVTATQSVPLQQNNS
jgi:hypothetical protein